MTNSAHPFIVSKNFSMPILVSYSKTISMPILVSYSKTISMFILVSTLVRPFLCRPVLISYSKTTPTLVLVTGSQMTFLYILLSTSQTIILCLVPIYHCFDSNRVFIGGKDSNAIAWKTWILLANSLVPRLPCTEIQTWQLWGRKELSIFSHVSDIKV